MNPNIVVTNLCDGWEPQTSKSDYENSIDIHINQLLAWCGLDRRRHMREDITWTQTKVCTNNKKEDHPEQPFCLYRGSFPVHSNLVGIIRGSLGSVIRPSGPTTIIGINFRPPRYTNCIDGLCKYRTGRMQISCWEVGQVSECLPHLLPVAYMSLLPSRA